MLHRLPVLDLAVIGLYFAGTMALGIAFMRRSRSTAGYMAAGGKLPAWLVGMSIFATYVSSISFLALPGKAYQTNWNAFTFSLAIPLAAWVAVRFFVPLYRERNEVSAYSYLEHRFGPAARGYAALFYLLTQVARMGMIMYLLALPLSALLGWDVKTVIVITGLTTTIYSMLGGIEGVIWTDAIQGFILIGGALLCALILLFGVPGGPARFAALAVEHHKFSLGSFDLKAWGQATFWVVLLNGLFVNLNNFGIDQNYVQRYITAEDETKARRAVWLGSLLYLPVSFIFFFIGTGLFAYYAGQPGLLPAALRAPEAADRVFPWFIVTSLPAGVRGLLIAAIFAAAMSTIASCLNSSATILYTDFYKRYFRKQAAEREAMGFLYGASLAWGVLGTWLALKMINVKSALDMWWKLSSIFSGGMLGLFLLGYFVPRAGKAAAWAGMAAGVLAIAWMSLTPTLWAGTPLAAWRSPLHDFLVIVVGTLVIFCVGFAITLASRPTGREDALAGARAGRGTLERNEKEFASAPGQSPEKIDQR